MNNPNCNRNYGRISNLDPNRISNLDPICLIDGKDKPQDKKKPCDVPRKNESNIPDKTLESNEKEETKFSPDILATQKCFDKKLNGVVNGQIAKNENQKYEPIIKIITNIDSDEFAQGYIDIIEKYRVLFSGSRYIFPSSADKWIKNCEGNPLYTNHKRALQLINLFSNDNDEEIKEIKTNTKTLVDLGPGNGQKTAMLMKICNKYVGIDISDVCLRYTIEALEKEEETLGRKFEKTFILSDFSELPTKGIEYFNSYNYESPRLICLLGNTVGNFQHQTDIPDFGYKNLPLNQDYIFQILTDSLGPDDYALIDFQRIDSMAEISHIQNGYDNPMFKNFAIDPLIQLGVIGKNYKGKINTWLDVSKRIIGIYTLRMDYSFSDTDPKKGTWPRKNLEIDLTNHDKPVEIHSSSKYTKEGIERLLSKHGLSIVKMYESPSPTGIKSVEGYGSIGTYVIVLVKKLKLQKADPLDFSPANSDHE